MANKSYPVELGSGPEYKEKERISLPIEDVEHLKLGQEVVVTIRGCVSSLELTMYGAPDSEKACICIAVDTKTLRKTSNSQAEGIRKLTEAEDY